MRIKRFNEDFENNNNNYYFDYDYVYHCFSDILEYIDPKTDKKDDKCKISKKEFSTMDYAVIECEDITILGEYGNITGYRGKKLTDQNRKVTHSVTDDLCISIDDYVDLINKGTYDDSRFDFNSELTEEEKRKKSDREFLIYDKLLIGFKKLRDEYPEYTYMFVKKGGSQESTLSLEIYPEY